VCRVRARCRCARSQNQACAVSSRARHGVEQPVLALVDRRERDLVLQQRLVGRRVVRGPHGAEADAGVAAALRHRPAALPISASGPCSERRGDAARTGGHVRVGGCGGDGVLTTLRRKEHATALKAGRAPYVPDVSRPGAPSAVASACEAGIALAVTVRLSGACPASQLCQGAGRGARGALAITHAQRSSHRRAHTAVWPGLNGPANALRWTTAARCQPLKELQAGQGARQQAAAWPRGEGESAVVNDNRRDLVLPHAAHELGKVHLRTPQQ